MNFKEECFFISIIIQAIRVPLYSFKLHGFLKFMISSHWMHIIINHVIESLLKFLKCQIVCEDRIERTNRIG